MAELTETQTAYVEWRADPGRQGSKEAWGADHGVSDDTLRRWEKTAWYRDAMDKLLAERNVNPERIQEVLDSLQREAARGDVSAARAYMDYVRDLQPARRLVEDVRIESLSDEQLEAAWRDGLATVE